MSSYIPSLSWNVGCVAGAGAGVGVGAGAGCCSLSEYKVRTRKAVKLTPTAVIVWCNADAGINAGGEAWTAGVALLSEPSGDGTKGTLMASMANRCMGLSGAQTSQGTQPGLSVQRTARSLPSMQSVVVYRRHSSPWTTSCSSITHSSRPIFTERNEVI